MQPSNESSSAYSFELETAELYSPNFPERVFDIKNIVIDIDIFESIEKPYLTGNITVINDNDLYSVFNFNGIQSIKLGFRLPEKGHKAVYKRFYIDKTIQNIKATDRESTILFHMIEDIGYVSEFININNVFEGKGSEIIRKIVMSYFDRKVVFVDEVETIEPQYPIKVVVPNLTPVETMNWVLDRMTAEDGSPFYLYSTLSGSGLSRDKLNTGLFLKNWQTMVNQVNRTNSPFVYSTAETNRSNTSIEQQMFVIQSHYDNESADITTLNDSGFVNSKFLFHDVNTNTTYIPGYDEPTVNYGSNRTLPYGKRWTAKGFFEKGLVGSRLAGAVTDKYPQAGRIPYDLNIPPTTQGDVNPLISARPESRVIAQVFSSATHDPKFYSYLEGRNDNDHLTKINSKAIKNWSMFSPLTFAVPGRLFLNGNVNATIGVKYRLQFISGVGEQARIDSHRTGDYLMYAARHVFSRDAGYTVHFTGVKLTGGKPGPQNNVDAAPISSNISTPITGPQ
jgi:hypothetical protein